MSRYLYLASKWFWMCTVGFMIALHNAYFQQNRLRHEDRMEELMEFPDQSSLLNFADDRPKSDGNNQEDENLP